MKAIIFTVLFAFLLISTQSQVHVDKKEKEQQESWVPPQKFPDSLKTHKIYGGVGIGFPWLFSADVTYLSKQNIGLSINYSTYDLRAVNLPSNYESSLYGINPNPKDRFRAVNILFVIDIRTYRQKFRPGFEFGPSLVTYEEAEFHRKDPGWGVFFGESNYEVTYSSEFFPGLQVRAKFEILFNHLIGLELAISGNINKYRPFAGLEATFLIGRVREKNLPGH